MIETYIVGMDDNAEEQVFQIDIDGAEDPAEQDLKKPQYYVDHFMVEEKDEGLIDLDASKVTTSSETCWNCDKTGHSLRECPLPIDRVKINKAKKNFTKAQAGSKRYHDNKFAKFRPGVISEELRDALGLRSNELPHHIYMMRVLGYPPGWLAEAKITNSGIKMYNDRGKKLPEPGQEDGEILNKIMKYDVEKIVEFPGFNVRTKRDTIDKHRSLGYPPMKSEHKIKNYIKYLQEISNRIEEMSEDSTDDEVKDMELSEMWPSEIIEEVSMINKRINEIDNKSNMDSILNLSNNVIGKTDSRKRNSNEGNEDILDEKMKRVKTEKKEKSEDDLEEGELDEDSNSSKETQENSNENNSIPEEPEEKVKRSLPIDIIATGSQTSSSSPIGSVTSTSFGTPNLKSHSPYSKLPSFDNFNKDISDVIDFENLPDSVGKYDSMCTIISKIRGYMTSKSNKKEDKPDE